MQREGCYPVLLLLRVRPALGGCSSSTSSCAALQRAYRVPCVGLCATCIASLHREEVLRDLAAIRRLLAEVVGCLRGHPLGTS